MRTVSVGQTFRDKYYDGKSPRAVFRRVRVVEVLGDRARVETVVACDGSVPDRPRKTLVKVESLLNRTLFELVEG